MGFEMIDKSMLVIAFLLGVVLSGVYFGLLWLTVRQLVHRTRPEAVLLLSLLLRLFLLLSSFYLILHYGNWLQLLSALAGFMTLRILLLRKFKPGSISKRIATDTEAT
jgi:F1F0 ATPase subunit 2